MPQISVACQICGERKMVDINQEGEDVFHIFFDDEQDLWLCKECANTFNGMDFLIDCVRIVRYCEVR